MRRLPRLACALLAALAVGLPAPAQAVPGDPVAVQLSPDDGAVVTGSADGITVHYACPAYRQSQDDSYPDTVGYYVDFASSPALQADGRLTGAAIVDSDFPSRVGDGTCTGTMKKPAAGGPGPEQTPGTYWWQVTRHCDDCPTGWEVTAVRSFTVTLPVTLKVSTASQPYDGYASLLKVTATGVPDRSPVVVERQVHGAWRSVATVKASHGAAEAVATLPAGHQTLRARAGTQVSSTYGVTVKKGARRTTKASDDGTYRGPHSAKLTVTGSGRELHGFQLPLNAYCADAVNPRSQYVLASVKKVRVAPDGRFVVVSTPTKNIRVQLSGQLKGRKVVGGRISYTAGECFDQTTWSATHV